MTAKILYLCTGNAARSVMATVMTKDRLPHATVWGAGTHSIEDLPMSTRTRLALERHGLRDTSHRSHQLTADDVERADVIVAFEPMHILYMQRRHPEGAARTALLPLLADRLDRSLPLTDALAALALADHEPEPWEEVIDPAGGDQDVFDASADQISSLLDEFLARFA